MAQAKAKQATATKTATRKTASKSSASSGTAKMTEALKEAPMAGLGVYGKLFDVVQERLQGVRTAAPRRWDDFVKRGEEIKEVANDRVNGISFSYRFDMEEQRAKFRDVVDALRAFVTPSKA